MSEESDAYKEAYHKTVRWGWVETILRLLLAVLVIVFLLWYSHSFASLEREVEQLKDRVMKIERSRR